VQLINEATAIELNIDIFFIVVSLVLDYLND